MLITVNKCCAQTFVTVSCKASKGHEATEKLAEKV